MRSLGSPSSGSFYEGFHTYLSLSGVFRWVTRGRDPWAAPSGNPADITQYLPNEAAIVNGSHSFLLQLTTARTNCPIRSMTRSMCNGSRGMICAIEIGYVGNLGRHGVIPIPFNQPGIASPSNIIHPGSPYPQEYTYGYTVVDSNFNPINLPNGQPFSRTMKAETWISAFPISVIRRNPRLTKRLASRPTMRCRLTSKTHEPRAATGLLLYVLSRAG